MRLSEFIRAHSEAIIAEWESFAQTLATDAHLSSWVLRDHAAAIIKHIADNMEQPQITSEEIAKARGEGPSGPIERAAVVHVGLRIESGFDLVQIIAEYRALRSCVPRLWRTSDPESFAAGAAEIVRFGEAIDQNIAEAIAYYEEREVHYRDRFLGMVGHDLRNPLNAIVIGAQALALQPLTEKQRAIVARIARSTQRLDWMVNDLLDFARRRLGGSMPVALEQADLAALVHEVIDEVRSTHDGSEIQFAAEGDLSGSWDPQRIKQMLTNLLLNAIEHGDGHKITVTASGDRDTVLLAVHNDGPPIAKEMIPTIFDPLVRGDDPVSKRTGLGLGLFIVREIVSVHRGTITVESSDDQGTTFSVRLPRTIS